MTPKWLLHRLAAVDDRRVPLAAIGFVVAYTFFGFKFGLVAGRFLVLGGLVAGLVLGLSVDDRGESVAAAFAVSVLSVVVLFVVFLLDDVRVASAFGVMPAMVNADPGSFGTRLLVFGAYELVVMVGLAPLIAITAVVGALLGSILRPFVAGEIA